jgi:hypothetical protein
MGGIEVTLCRTEVRKEAMPGARGTWDTWDSFVGIRAFKEDAEHFGRKG